MCFKRLKKIQQSLDDLKTAELGRLRDESKELKELKEILENVRFGVKNVQAYEDGTVRISYDIKPVILSKDSNGNWVKNNLFYAINYLGLIDIKDMGKIKKVLDSVE